MKQETTLQKQNKHKLLTDSDASIVLKDILRPVLSLIARTRVPYEVIVEYPCQQLPDRPVIYAVNHHSYMDTPIVCRTIPKRGYIFSGKQRLGFTDWLYFVLNGVIFVDRKNKADMAASKDALLAYLGKNQSIIIFPEGTWNLTDSEPMMHMKWGIIDVAKEAGAQIVPIILEYDRENKKCFMRFGSPLVFTPIDNKADGICKLRDTMATMRWKSWERKGIFSRAEMDIDAERKVMRYSIKEYPLIDWEYESSCIYQPYLQAEIIPPTLIPDRNNAFLFRK